MSRDTVHRPLSKAEGFAHIESYLRIGLSPTRYYRSQHLSECQFYNRRRKYMRVHPELADNRSKAQGEKKRFHELKFDKESIAVSSISGLEIRYPNGVRIVIPVSSCLDTDTLSSLIKLWE